MGRMNGDLELMDEPRSFPQQREIVGAGARTIGDAAGLQRDVALEGQSAAEACHSGIVNGDAL